MVLCAVFGCPNGFRRNQKLSPSKRVSLYSFPSDEVYCRKWISFCGRRDNVNVKCARMCAVHFTADDRIRSLQNILLGYSPKHQRKLKHDAVPTLNGPKAVKVADQLKENERQERLGKRVNRKIARFLVAESTEISSDMPDKASMNFKVIDADSVQNRHRYHGMGSYAGDDISIKEEPQEDVEFELEDGTPTFPVDPLRLDDDPPRQSWQQNADVATSNPNDPPLMIKSEGGMDDYVHDFFEVADDCSWIKKERAEREEALNVDTKEAGRPGQSGCEPFKIKLEQEETHTEPLFGFVSAVKIEDCAGTEIPHTTEESLHRKINPDVTHLEGKGIADNITPTSNPRDSPRTQR